MNFDYPAAVHFRCIKCGICCGDTREKNRHILLLETEAEQIAKATGRKISKFAAKTEGKAPYSHEMKKRENGKCVFLENDRCTIYFLRPLICRFYPFEMNFMINRRYVFLYTDECPGIGKGRVRSEGYFKKMFQLACNKLWQVSGSNGKS